MEQPEQNGYQHPYMPKVSREYINEYPNVTKFVHAYNTCLPKSTPVDFYLWRNNKEAI